MAITDALHDLATQVKQDLDATYEAGIAAGVASVPPSSPLPIEVSSEEEMTAILEESTEEDIGLILLYTGTTGIYTNGAFYKIEEADAITDVTNTTWYIPAGWTAPASWSPYWVKGTITYSDGTVVDIPSEGFAIGCEWDMSQFIYSPLENSIGIAFKDSIPNTESFTVAFTGGIDSTRSELISWLENNGQLLGEDGEPIIAPVVKFARLYTEDDVAVERDEGVAEGQKAERAAFWNTNQNNGNRTIYTRAYTGYGFSFDNFYPHHDIRPTTAQYLFYAWENKALSNQRGDLTWRLNKCDVVLDTSQCTSLSYAFAYSCFTVIPTVDFTSLTANAVDVFRGCSFLETIEKIIVRQDLTYSNWFKGVPKLARIQVEGTIGNNINFQECKVLSGESAFNICEHLLECGNGDEQTPAGTYTIYFHANTWSRLGGYLKAMGIVSSLDDYGGVKEWLYAWRGWNGA